MKILRFDEDRLGVLGADGTHILEISDLISHRAERGPQRVMEVLIENFDSFRPEIEARLRRGLAAIPLASVRLLAPIPRPSKVLGAFLNYLDAPDRKLELLPNEFFHKAPELLGPEGTIELMDLPAVKEFNPEAELAFVIGRHAKHVGEAEAMDYVFGYVPFFDVSARGIKRRSLVIPKGQDTFAPCGPWITTKDEVPDAHDLRVRSWVSGAPRQDFSTKDMAHKIPDQLSWLSRFLQLNPGDVIATGTHHKGLGCLNPGDTLEIEIERLGRARFLVGGGSPHKDTRRIPELRKPDPLPPGFTITPI